MIVTERNDRLSGADSLGDADRPRPLDREPRPLRPRLAVAEEDGVGVQLLELRERLERLRRRAIECGRHQLRAGGAGERVVVAERVAGEEEAGALDVEARVAGGVARRVERARP